LSTGRRSCSIGIFDTGTFAADQQQLRTSTTLLTVAVLLQHISESLGEPLHAPSELATHRSNVSTCLSVGGTTFGSISELITSIDGRLMLRERRTQRGNVRFDLGGTNTKRQL
jgi:hypothetical protein